MPNSYMVTRQKVAFQSVGPDVTTKGSGIERFRLQAPPEHGPWHVHSWEAEKGGTWVVVLWESTSDR
jgi:hypothetical protein